MSQQRMEVEIKVGFFVAIGMALVCIAILLLGSSENIMSRKVHYNLHMKNIEGLIGGAKVMLGGIQIGTVERVQFDNKAHDVRVDLNVTNETASNIKQDSVAEIATQGMLGDKFVALTPGSDDAAPLAGGSEIPVRSSPGLNQFISKSDQLLLRLTSTVTTLDKLLKDFDSGNRSEKFFQGMAMTAKNFASASEKLDREMDDFKMKKIVKNLESITDKINNGTGTVGSLINDPALYDNFKNLVGEVNRNRIMRNLVRQTLKESEDKAAAPGKK